MFRRSSPGIWAQTHQTQCSRMMGCSGSHLTSQLYLDGTMPQNNEQAVTGHFFFFFALFLPALSCDTSCVRRMLGWVCQILLDKGQRFTLCPHKRSEQKWRQAWHLLVHLRTQAKSVQVTSSGPMPGAWRQPQLSPVADIYMYVKKNLWRKQK